MAQEPSPLDVRPLAIGVGAEIHGVDLTASLSDAAVTAIRQALLEWKVVFFRGQALDPADHVAFARCFGVVDDGHPSLPSLEGFPQIMPLAERGPAEGGAVVESQWHSDVSWSGVPPMGSILHAVAVPEFGGDTQWINMAMAYAALSAPLRDLLDGLHAVHRNRLHLRAMGEGVSSGLARTFSQRSFAAVHPVVRVHPETGERALYVNPSFTSHIVELTARESAGLLGVLYDHMTAPEFVVRFRWERDSVAFWDNRAAAHRAPNDFAIGLPTRGQPADPTRRMHRVTITGDAPVGVDGMTSRELDPDGFL